MLPSAANFVFARHPGHDAAELAAALRERSIIVRHFKAARIDQFLRITVGTDAQCALLVDGAEGHPRLTPPHTRQQKAALSGARLFCGPLAGSQVSSNHSALQAHLRRAGVGLQALAVGQHRRDLAQGLGAGLRRPR